MNMFQKLSKLPEISLGNRLTLNLWFIPVAFCAFWGNYAHLFFCTFAIALIHELSHILCSKLLGIKISRIAILPFGISAMLSHKYIRNSEKEFLIAFAGPFSNILMFWIFMFVSENINYPLLNYCADANLAMCAVNLIPAIPLDGGRMIKAILTSKMGVLRAYNFMLRLSRVMIFLILFIALLLFFFSNFNFSLILITVFLLQNLSREQQSITHIAMREILENNKKIRERQAFPVKTFCVQQNTRISVILKLLSYDYFCIINILDSNSNLLKSVTESQLISILSEKGIQTKFSEI